MMRPAQWMVFVWVALVSFADLVRSNLDSYDEQDDICSFIRKSVPLQYTASMEYNLQETMNTSISG